MTHQLTAVLGGLGIGYFLAVNSTYLVLVVIAGVEFARHLRWAPLDGREDVYADPAAPAISVIAPVHDEEAVIVESVHGMLALRYPRFEVVLVDDGSTDGTFERLRAAFDLVPVPRVVPADVPTRVAVREGHTAASGVPLTVVRKDNSGRADAVNVGVNAARHPLVCFVDADSILDPDALLAVAQPFADDPDRVVATGGVVRPVNGCRVSAGRVVDVRMPRGWLPRIQVVEYLRAFLLGRTGWSRLGALLLISGAFGLFRRDLVVAVGGLDAGCIGEDMELVVRMHRLLREQGRPYRIVSVGEPVSWTEVPSSLRVLAAQRRRWARGLCEVLWRHRRLAGNPRYGRIGLLGVPAYVAFELLAPFVELFGVGWVVAGAATGTIGARFTLTFLLVSVGYGMLVSLASLAVEELAFHRYRRWSDLPAAVLAVLAENLGYRQLTAIWRVQGTWSALRRTEQVWGRMTRTGFDTGLDPTLDTALGAAPAGGRVR